MAFQWSLTLHNECPVFSLTGGLSDSDATHKASAVAWVSARCSSPVVVDLQHLWAFRTGGEVLLGDCIARLTPPGVILCLPESGVLDLTDDRSLSAPRIHRLSDAPPALSYLERRIASGQPRDP